MISNAERLQHFHKNPLSRCGFDWLTYCFFKNYFVKVFFPLSFTIFYLIFFFKEKQQCLRKERAKIFKRFFVKQIFGAAAVDYCFAV